MLLKNDITVNFTFLTDAAQINSSETLRPTSIHQNLSALNDNFRDIARHRILSVAGKSLYNYCVLHIYKYSNLFSVFTSPWSKLKIVTIQRIKSRLWYTIDDWYINNLAKNQVSAVFHSRVICRSVSPKFIELCMETPCLCPSEGHKYGGRNVTKTSVPEFCYWNEKSLL